MEDIPSQELIDATRAALSPFQKDFPNKPKYFNRPPIKFISLIIGAINKSTGFGKNFFSESELNAGLVTKEEKLNFFKKLKEYTQLLLGDSIDVEYKMIAAGKEVSKTLKFMQLCVKVAQNPKISFSQAAARLRQPESPQEVNSPDNKKIKVIKEFKEVQRPQTTREQKKNRFSYDGHQSKREKGVINDQNVKLEFRFSQKTSIVQKSQQSKITEKGRPVTSLIHVSKTVTQIHKESHSIFIVLPGIKSEVLYS